MGVGLGNQGMRKIEAGVSGTAGPDGALDYAVGLAHTRSSGFDSKASGVHNPDDDGYRSTSASAKLGYRINAQHQLGATLLANRLNSAYDAFSYLPEAPGDDRNQHRLRRSDKFLQVLRLISNIAIVEVRIGREDRDPERRQIVDRGDYFRAGQRANGDRQAPTCAHQSARL